MSECLVDVELLKTSLSASNTIDFIDDVDLIEHLSYAMFVVTEVGPVVQYSNVSEITLPPDTTSSEAFLHKLAITCISTLGFGQEYIQGVLELPSFGVPNHRLVLLSTLLETENPNHRHDNHMEYFQLAIWFPREFLVGIPPLSIFENLLLCSLKESVKCVMEPTAKEIHDLKISLTQLILATAICKNV